MEWQAVALSAAVIAMQRDTMLPKPGFAPPQARTNVSPRRMRGLAPKLVAALLVLLLLGVAMAPAFAGNLHRSHHASDHHHGQDVDAAKKKGGKTTVTKRFTNDLPIAIPAAGATDEFGPADLYPATLQVSGFKRKPKILDVNLTLLGFSHVTPFDVDLLLVAPGGRNAVVMGDVGNAGGGGGVTNLTLKLDDEAADPLPEVAQLTSGTFRPLDSMGPTDSDVPDLLAFPAPAPTASGSDALFNFDGINPNGQWQLFALDDASGGTGSLDGWTLEIIAKSKRKHKH